jgi:zinc transporter ZupT
LFRVLVHEGNIKGKLLYTIFVSALTAIAVSLITYYLASYMQGARDTFLVPFVAVGFIYIATDLMPELHKKAQTKESLTQLTTILAGIELISILKVLSAP